MNTETKNQPSDQANSSGESMKDSMAETSPGNDNSLITPAEELTNEKGELDPEQLKESYNPNKIDHKEQNHGRQ